MRIELIYDSDCPNAEEARRNLTRALRRAGRPAAWRERERSAPDTPAYARAFGSPTILMDGRDVADDPPGGAACCRLYADADGGFRGAPTVETIASALARGDDPRTGDAGKKVSRGGWKAIPAAIPGIGAALLPNLTCPACWPAYAGLLSALGVGFVDYTPWLLPLTSGLMGVALLSLGYRARIRGDYRPFLVGIAGAAVLMIGRFVLESDGVTYAGVALFIGASAWNALRPRRKDGSTCPSCRPDEPADPDHTHAPA